MKKLLIPIILTNTIFANIDLCYQSYSNCIQIENDHNINIIRLINNKQDIKNLEKGYCIDLTNIKNGNKTDIDRHNFNGYYKDNIYYKYKKIKSSCKKNRKMIIEIKDK